jgi:RimJ/RimL family protein N-acetyltransferase
VGVAEFRKPKLVVGHQLRFRDAKPEDAAFILRLRLDPAKNQHLSSTSGDLDAQRAWLERYQADTRQLYFIITDHAGQAIGTVRLYDKQGLSFCWGSWILSEQAPRSSAVESTLMVYEVGLACGFTQAHFDVRRANVKVWQYHERFGAVRTGENDQDYLYEIGEEAIRAALHRYASRLPAGVSIEW